jgi:hypothetical protein
MYTGTLEKSGPVTLWTVHKNSLWTETEPNPHTHNTSHNISSPSMALYLTILALFTTISAASAATSYKNYTVGGTAGWFFNSTTNTSATNYSSWASTQTFNLGDYLSKPN